MKTQKLLLSVILLISIFNFAHCQKEKIGDPTGNIDKQLLIDLVNSYRTSGCRCGSTDMPPVEPIVWNKNLEKAAKQHSEDMNNRDYFSHTGSDGSSTGDRIMQNNYLWSLYGENIGKGYSNEQAVVKGWINSPPHCKNIMNPRVKDMGVARSGAYWTQVLAAGRSR